MAKYWADLVDGGINASLVAGGFSSNFWRSGVEDDFRNAIPAAANCNGFTSNLAIAYGNAGNAATNGAGWMNIGPKASNNTYALVCIASPYARLIFWEPIQDLVNSYLPDLLNV